MSTGLAPIQTQRESLTERVYDAIREAIVTRSLAPGAHITETSLAEQLNVSKTPVREALLKLEYIGLIESSGRRGGRVVSPSRDSIRMAYELRVALEVQAARINAERGESAGVEEARSFADACLAAAKEGDRQGFREEDRKFHLSLAGATGNGTLERLIHDAFDLTWALRLRDVPVADDSLECAEQHIAIADAIQSGDIEGADSAMRKHIAKVQSMVVAAFDREHI